MMTNTNQYSLDERIRRIDLSTLPYEFADNVKALTEQARQTWVEVQDLESSACPDNHAQITVTMHPTFAYEINCPEEFLQVMGLQRVGCRQVQCFPRDTSSSDTEDGDFTIAIVCIAKREDIQSMINKLGKIVGDTFVGKQMRTIESIEAVNIYDRLDIPNDYFGSFFLASVYQTPGKTIEESRKDFEEYAKKNSLEVHPDFSFEKDGMFYVLLKGARYVLDAIADYAYTCCVRVPPERKV